MEDLVGGRSSCLGPGSSKSRIACHVISVEWQRADDHAQDPHRTRTTPVQIRSNTDDVHVPQLFQIDSSRDNTGA